LCPQTPGNHFDSRIFVQCFSFWWCSKDPRFPVIWGVRRQDFWAVASLCDAFQVPKPLSPQLQLYGKSDDDLGKLTFGVVRFLLCPHLADDPRGPADSPRRSSSSRCSSCSCFVSFRSGLAFGFCCSWFADGPSFSSGRSATHADGPPGLCERSVFLGSLLLVLCVLSDGPRRGAGQSAGLARTVRGIRPDGSRGQCGRSAPPGRTVRQSLCALLLGSIPPFLSCASTCASRNRS
jgi:hypothetical protein